MNVAIFGGAFNPVHLGHTEIAKLASKIKKFDKFFFMPSNLSAHKCNKNLVSNFHRLNMLKLALENTDFLISDAELQRGDISYTVDTVKYFKNLYDDCNIFFICGEDILSILPTFNEYEFLIKNVNFLVFKRDDSINECNDATVKFFHIDKIDISSSKIRENIKNKKYIKNMLNKKVFDYIIKNRLYENK